MKYQVVRTYEVEIPDDKNVFVKLTEYVFRKSDMGDDECFELIRDLRAEAYNEAGNDKAAFEMLSDNYIREWVARQLVELFHIGDADGIVTNMDEEVIPL